MTTPKNVYCLLVLVLLTGLICSTALMAQPAVGKVVFSLERHRGHLGSGAGISPNGNLVAYIGDDNGLYIYNVANKTTTLVLKQAEDLDVFTNPTFSPDNSTIAFSASGGTAHYPADLFTVNIDGTDLKRLTTTESIENPEGGDPLFIRYNDAPQFSPDGSYIAFLARDVIHHVDYTDIIGVDGSDRRTLAKGIPVTWSNDGRFVLFSEGEAGLQEIPVSGGSSTRIASHPAGHLLGRLTNGEIVERTGRSVQTVSEARSQRPSVSLNVVATKTASVPALSPRVVGQDDPSILLLRSVMGANSGRLLLTYVSDDVERIEVVELTTAR